MRENMIQAKYAGDGTAAADSKDSFQVSILRLPNEHGSSGLYAGGTRFVSQATY